MGQIIGNPGGAAGPVADTDRRPPAQPPPVEGGHRAPPGRRAGRFLLIMAAALALVAAGGAAGADIALHYGKPAAPMIAAAPPAAGRPAARAGEGLARVAAAVLPSVVTITVTTATGTGEGSGVILRSDGTIVTNSHVIEGAAGGGA